MSVIPLSPLDLSLAALMVLALAVFSWRWRLGIERSLLIAAARTTLQLLLIGLVLEALFANVHLAWITVLGLAMLLLAAREVMARQKRRLAGPWGFGVGAVSMFISAFAVTVMALLVLVRPTPWYAPQYAIPLLGMLLGNSMNGIALGIDHLTKGMAEGRAVIEGRLTLGTTWSEAVAPLRRESIRVGLIPIINAMAAAGVISLPGMMTGQILAGSPPVAAVQYQILIMFLIAAVTGLGSVTAVLLVSRRLFDARERLRLERLTAPDAR